MRKQEKVAIGKMGIAGGLAIVVIVAFTVPLGLLIPPLGNFLLPGGGVWDAAGEVPDSEEMVIPGMSEDVRVFRDQWGVPHIYGLTEADTLFALGYCHAQDRLFQMDFARRLTRGQLAEVLGPDYHKTGDGLVIEMDRYNQFMGKEYWANETDYYMQTSTNATIQMIYRLLLNYTAGVNYYMTTHKTLPIEFRFLAYEPKPWTTLDTLCMAKLMAEMLTWDYEDIERFNSMYGLGAENYTELFGNPQPFQIPVCPDYGNYSDITAPLSAGLGGDLPFAASAAFSALMEKVMQIPQELDRSALGPVLGSNNWVVNGSHTTTGKPILCNDMHLSWDSPGIWYEAHLVGVGTDLSFYGFFIPGVPVPIAGHNAYVGWGYTNVFYDVIDWYYYTPVNYTHYIHNHVETEYNMRTISIAVKGQAARTFTVRSTKEGPVMSDLSDLSSDLALNNASMQSMPIACRWTAQNITFEFLALYGMLHAQNRTAFSDATRDFANPAQNMVYADIDGNIGIRPTGLVPVRDDSNIPSWHTGNGSMPYNGSAGEGEWINYIPFDKLPHSENPAQGYLVSANQISAGPNYVEYALQNDYDDGYRARRINTLIATKIKNGELISVDTMKQFQLDVCNVLAESLTPILLDVLESEIPSMTSTQQAAYNALSSWDYEMDKDEFAPTIFSVWSEAYLEDTFKDEMTQYSSAYPTSAVLENLTINSTSTKWFDNINTPAVETRNDTMVAAFNHMLVALADYYQTSTVSAWIWGTIHKSSFPHLLGLSALGAGPYAHNGTSDTVTPSWASNYKNGKVAVGIATGGSSERVIMDFSDLSKTISVIPSGERGIPTSKHYHDQLWMFLRGEYHTQYFGANTISLYQTTATTESSIWFKAGGA